MIPRGIGKLDHACQTGRHPDADRGFDLYETPAAAVEALICAENLPLSIWECAAGRGSIVNVLRAHGHHVIASDPPYRLAEQFVANALDLVPRLYLLLRLAFIESQRRTDILEHRGLARIHVFRKRLPIMHRDGWTGPRASSAIPFSWFVWDRAHCGLTIVDGSGAAHDGS